ncbi:hypothetical protein ACWEQ8_40655 [Streptomyces noursei]
MVAARAEAAAERPESNLDVSVAAPTPIALPEPRPAAIAPPPASQFDDDLVLEDLPRQQILG